MAKDFVRGSLYSGGVFITVFFFLLPSGLGQFIGIVKGTSWVNVFFERTR